MNQKNPDLKVTYNSLREKQMIVSSRPTIPHKEIKVQETDIGHSLCAFIQKIKSMGPQYFLA